MKEQKPCGLFDKQFRLSFMRSLGLTLADQAPDAKWMKKNNITMRDECSGGLEIGPVVKKNQ